ncbi:hypothetical protein A3A20_02310 [Candidatus Wolfebacteria bacterium RIFCSPLOWO2_01_FULL_45_19]|uniref:peptide chain release factor N(5)-glutamine methyltransferase n=1 Tax=Candidatus Wolfebacteria bacterium RIFCSPLOWO2_01_FULL_45_19 TaxID=1802557 RepID=A0A1F8DT31_9BACT|nr:MAG: Protoporphyrinogen oxidase [Parcubacteria group bacterium GW2011_GWB1_45_9]OGM91744.1 MAG: hypothetical protein A3A20_02310 [Candidatus Wolfebacteria bacterium RIFCSPLOWO2_01_FULL_45_19]
MEQETKWLVGEKYGGRVTARNRGAVKKDVERLNIGEPVDYVIGFVEFAGCKIDLSLRPLIPRVETEYWTEKAIDDTLDDSRTKGRKNLSCLDVFAGSGCVGIAVLKHVPYITMDFAEKESAFLEQIKINLKLNNLRIEEQKNRVIQSDVFSNIFGSYDYIFANPPYIAEARKKEVQQSVLDWEPAGTVFGGKDGLIFIDKFLKDALAHLNSNGKLYMEFGSEQKPDVERILKKYNYGKYDFYRDQFGSWRYATINGI